MRFHPLAVSAAVGALGSSSVANAFVLPKSASTGSGATTIRMAAKNSESYSNLEEYLFADPNRNDGSNVDSTNANTNAENPSTKPKKQKKPNPRAEKLRAKLEADLSAAEESRARTAQQLADAEASRQALEAQAEKAAKEAQALEAKVNAFEAKQAAGGGLSAAGIFGEIAGPFVGGIAAFGGLAAARGSLAARSEKAEEERLQREAEEKQAEQAAKRRAAQEGQTKNLLPIVGAGVAGLGAFGAFFNNGNGGDTVVDAITKNVETKVGQQNNAGSVTTSVPDPATVQLPYLDKEIKKAETKQKQIKPLSKMQARKAAEEQKAVEARLEQKLAQAPDIAQQASEAEAKASEAARIEAEKKAAEEQKALEAKQGAEKKAAEEAAAAAEKEKADKIAADKLAFEKLKAEQAAKSTKLAEEEQAKRDKIAADKLAFEKMKEEQKAQEQLRAREKEAAAALESLKQQDAQWKDFIPKVPAVSEMLFGDNKPSLITDKGLSNIFGPNLVVVGGVALAGIAVATAVAAANESPSVNSTFKVTGKSPKEYLESGDPKTDAKGSPSPKKTIRIPKPEKPVAQAPPDIPETPPAPGSKEALREQMKMQRDNLSKQVAAKETSDEATADTTHIEASIVEDTGVVEPAFTPPAKKSYSPFGGKPRAVANDPLYAPPATQSTYQSFSPSPEAPAPQQNTIEDVSFAAMPKKSYSPFGGGKPKAVMNDPLYSPPATQFSDESIPLSYEETSYEATSYEAPTSEQSTNEAASFAAMPKKSYSPFGGGKPKAVANDPLYSPPATQFSDESIPPSYEATSYEAPTSEQSINEAASFAAMPKKSYSPFGGGKPKAVANDSLYSPPASPTMPDLSETEIPFEPVEPTTFSDTSGVTSSATFAAMPKKSYSPFGGGKPKAVASDPLYSPPTSYSVSEPTSFTHDMSEETPAASTMDSDGSSFDDSYLDSSAGGASDFASPAPYEPTISSPEVSSFTENSFQSFKKNYSPFGQKPYVATDDSLYGPPMLEGLPDYAEYDIPESEPSTASGSMPFAASGLDDTSGVGAPETTAFRAPSPKKSFSPFGTKPKAPSDTNNGGYLNEL